MLQKLAFVTLLLLFLLPPPSAGAQTVAAEASATYTFGQSLRFHLEVTAEQPVEAAYLFFSTPEIANTYVVDVELVPSRVVSLTHELPPSQHKLAPFTTVSYWWEVTVGDRRLRVEEDPRIDAGEVYLEADADFVDFELRVTPTIASNGSASVPSMLPSIGPAPIPAWARSPSILSTRPFPACKRSFPPSRRRRSPSTFIPARLSSDRRYGSPAGSGWVPMPTLN